MEAKIKSSVFLFSFIILFSFLSNKISAQAYAYGTAVLTPITHDEFQSKHGLAAIMTGTAIGGGTPLIGLGIGQNNPQYLLDILCNTSSSTNNDVNISLTLTSPPPNLTTI